MKRPTLQVGHLQQPLFPDWNDSLASVRPVTEGKRTQKVQELSLSPYTKPGPKFLISKSYFLPGTHQHFVFLLPDQCCEASVTSLMTVEVDTITLHCLAQPSRDWSSLLTVIWQLPGIPLSVPGTVQTWTF